jgi:hypothetical protein
MNEYILTADIAKKRDMFALMLFRHSARIVAGNKLLQTPDRLLHSWDVTNIEQYQGMGFDDMAERIRVIMEHPNLKLNTTLLVDGTGIGDAAVELIRKKGMYPIPVIFSGTGAVREHFAGMGEVFNNTSGRLSGARVLKEIVIPKTDLVTAGAVLMQQGRLRVAKGRWTEQFKLQLTKFKGKVNEKTGRVRYEAETEGDHDDMVVCYLMGAWWILNRYTSGREQDIITDAGNTSGWEPADYM